MTLLPLLVLLSSPGAVPAEAAEQCHYSYSVWNVKARKSLTRKEVVKPYAELTAKEQGPLGCTPCEEDQESILLSNGLKFKACRQASGAVRRALEAALSKGQRIVSIVGYRPQVSRGPVDPQGNRTELSNHSFGVAVDLNEEHNGLYERCPVWSPDCRLRKGGPYRPGTDPLSLTPDGPAVTELKKEGFLWGGLLEGLQKDFMHFSTAGS
jgi:hypothetical protein